MAKNTICVWYDKDAEAAARFYAETFPDSAVGAVHRAPGDYPSGKAGDVLTVEFTVAGVPCLGLNGGPAFSHSEAFSFQIATDNQQETDRYWNAIVGNGGQESACGWCKDRWGEVGLAYVVPVPGAEVSPETVIAHVRSKLARYKTPKRVIVSDTLPRTASGKLQKNLIRERALKELEAEKQA